MRKYLFLVSLRYGFPVMRPLQEAIRARGGQAAWFFDEPGLEQYLREDEKLIGSIGEAIRWSPDAVFTAGNHMYDFIPGKKIQVFHGFNISKLDGDAHFVLRGWFDLYCTHGENCTPRFAELAGKHKYFKVVETGWPKLDGFFSPDGTLPLPANPRPVVLYTSTFSRRVTSTPFLFEQIERLIQTREWDWIITFHPKMDPATVDKYKALEKYPNVTFYQGDDNIPVLQKADVMLSDSSSIIVEFLYLGKPAVTFRNTAPGDHLIDINDPVLLEVSLEKAISRPKELMENIDRFVTRMHPYRDGKSSERVLDAVDDLIEGRLGPRSGKPMNLLRKYKVRKHIGYFPELPWSKPKK